MKEIINLSNEPMGKLYNWLPHDLLFEKIVFFPDVGPSKGLIPTGTAVLTKQSDWRKYAVSDIGCGMMLLESELKLDDFNSKDWDSLMKIMKQNKTYSLGSGNHFLMNYVSISNEKLYFVIHTGSRLEGKDIKKYLDNKKLFDLQYQKIVDFAAENRLGIKHMIDKVFGQTKLLLDKPHNTTSILDNDEILIRKGSVSLLEGETTIIPSNMDGEMILVKGKSGVNNTLNSLSHGTGRIMSRGEAKEYAKNYDYNLLRKKIHIPSAISDDSIKTEAPFCYRNLDECMNYLGDIVEEVDRFIPNAYIGQL